MNPYHLPPGKNPPSQINCVVEIPKGSPNNYEFEPESGLMRLDRPLDSPMHYPGDYVFIPGTLAVPCPRETAAFLFLISHF